MVGGTNHEDTVVGFEPVYFIQEVRAYAWTDERVDVFEDQKAGCQVTGHLKDSSDRIFGAVAGGERFHVERVDGWGSALGEVVHEGFGRNGFAVLR